MTDTREVPAEYGQCKAQSDHDDDPLGQTP